MANTVTQQDRFAEAALKSMADFLTADLAAAWGGAGVEVVLATPDFDPDFRLKPDATREKRDLSAKPLCALLPRSVGTGPWAISPSGDEVERSMAVRIDLMASDHFKLLNLVSTVESVLDGAKSSTGGFDVKDPDGPDPDADPPDDGIRGVIYFDDAQVSAILSGPGDTADEGHAFPSGKAQYENLKHRASILVSFSVAKVRGSKVM